jgi:hypothetical protein
MKVLAYIAGLVGLSISAYGAFFAGLPGEGYAIFGVAVVVFANILHKESGSK